MGTCLCVAESLCCSPETLITLLISCEGESRSVVSDSLQSHGLDSPMDSRPEYWSGEPFPSPGDLPNPGFKPGSPALQVDSLPTELYSKTK